MPRDILNDILDKIQNPQNQPMGSPSYNYPGVPDSSDDDQYTTYRQASTFNTRSQQPIESSSNEDYGVKTPSGKELLVDSEEDDEYENLDETLENLMREQGEGEDQGLEDPMGDAQGGGSGNKDDENEQYSSEEIGRIYELKKIYSRLISVEGYLNVSNDEELMKLRNYTIQAIDLFKTLVYNLNKFMDQLDDIIIYFYNFLIKIYEAIRKRLKQVEKENE